MLRLRVMSLALLLGAVSAVAQNQNVSDWTKIGPAQSGVSQEKLRAMSAAIRTDAFKKIGSIVVARHGKLVYEDYVEGDVNTLRDTRSATKTITGVLVGIAIGEGKLSGVDAK